MSLLWIALAVGIVWIATKANDAQDAGHVSEVIYQLEHFAEGSDLVSLEEIQTRIVDAYDNGLQGADIQSLDLAALERFLDQEPFITKSHAFLDRSQRLHIHLSQRVPLLRVIDRSGANYYLDGHGVVLPLSAHFSARVPVVTGHVPSPHNWDSTYTALHTIHTMIEETRQDPFMSNWLESVHLDRHGQISLYGNVGRFAVKMGDGERLSHKLAKLKSFLQSGAQSLAWNSLESISLEFEGQIITRQKSKA